MSDLKIVGNKIVKTTVEEFDRYVDWDDIKGDVEPDDWSGEAPWESWDGWEHIFEPSSHHDEPERVDSYTYVNRSLREGGCGYIIVDEKHLYDGPSGCSKQVRFETLARSKRKATEQLVKWYRYGWNVYCATAKYGDYRDSLSGIYDDGYGDYTSECVEECRHEVAVQLEKDGYIVEGRPAFTSYDQVAAFKDQMKRNMGCSWGLR
jgi:hypothetical protein